MGQLVARKTFKLESDDRVFIEEGKTYPIVQEDDKLYVVQTEVAKDHRFLKSERSEAYFGKYFLLEEEVIAPVAATEVVEETIETPLEAAEEKKNTKKRK